MSDSFPQGVQGQHGKQGRTVSSKKQDPKGGSKFGIILNVVLALLLVGAGFFLVRAEQERRATKEALITKEQEVEEIRRMTEQQGKEVAEGILTKARGLMRIPENPEPTVATITNIEELRGASDFYEGAKNGDHLIITETRAILYDPIDNVIIDVVPVQITPDAPEVPEATDAPEAPEETGDANNEETESPEL